MLARRCKVRAWWERELKSSLTREHRTNDGLCLTQMDLFGQMLLRHVGVFVEMEMVDGRWLLGFGKFSSFSSVTIAEL